ncbi:GGDEF domain-containing protein [Pseudobutyrivibrio ruminis]|uniref:GGDEF domain-containing protein n=1 Tax=Pseudobutyrivibrio ruminis TaxID=46206 RepID=UPI000423C042|nr:GGDEF domain-containing protein [Pseudobutyrivibrio ruminis]
MKRKVISLAIAFIIFTLFLMLGHFFLKPVNYSNVLVLDDGWRIYYNNELYSDVKLSDFRSILGEGTHKGDIIMFVKDGIDLKDYVAPTVMFESRFSGWIVYEWEKEIARGYVEEFRNGAFIGCNNNFVDLPKSYGPITLRIAIMVGENGAYNYFDAPVVGGYTDVLMYGIYNHTFIFLLSAFLIIFGVIFFAVAICFRSNMPEINMQMYSAMLYIVLGIWFLTQFKLLDLFIETGTHQTEIEYISLYLVVPLMYMVMGSMRNYLKTKRFLVFVFLGTILPFSLIALHFLGKVHINRFLPLYQIDALVLILFMAFMIIIKDIPLNKVPPAQKIQVIGQIIFAASFIFNVFFYYLEVTGISRQIMLSKKIVPLGAMCMVFATLVNYNNFISESIARKNEYETLVNMAYMDELTGIANRFKYEKYIQSLENIEDDYCIISIDLNGLKAINDSEGHLVGDKYIKEFSQAIDVCFGKIGFIARIGGDEFVVILINITEDKVKELISKLNYELEQLNLQDPAIDRSAAIGYAFSYEVDGCNPNLIYQLADERMYKNKELSHSARR